MGGSSHQIVSGGIRGEIILNCFLARTSMRVIRDRSASSARRVPLLAIIPRCCSSITMRRIDNRSCQFSFHTRENPRTRSKRMSKTPLLLQRNPPVGFPLVLDCFFDGELVLLFMADSKFFCCSQPGAARTGICFYLFGTGLDHPAC